MYRKQSNEKWLILNRQGGGEIEVQEKDDALITDQGVFIWHNDPKKTTTFVPTYALAWVRSWYPKGGEVETGTLRARAPISPVHALESGEIVIEGEDVD